ncbi:MAG: hypothetical protein A2V81_00185 [Candidatus Abawacabacteria bacterium RBG_16_42_10]|uniref:LTD domain-containing protein n=1 Tax=Candidatus Abawacabacteria bacterium RBG_16_42_10 TaxID=1817814 RepID=A0A1F4XLG8_9BACT|nr:MAG: hypothetical protein A2V81_00185 [Candidatus Abawacabacteria bacterium RBG_16_42_10]
MIKKLSAFLVILSMVVFSSDIFLSPPAMAANSMDVVINEIAWAGSTDNSLDEWIELYNNTTSVIDLTNWTIEDDSGAQTYALTGIVPARGYFLLESRESATSIAADQVRVLSLSNNGDSLVLKDSGSNVIDTVNSGSTAWFTGSATTHATMERLSTNVSGDLQTNWQSSSGGGTATSSSGGSILGTPKASNSGIIPEPQILLTADNTEVSPGEQIIFSVTVTDAIDLSNYGFDMTYDASKLQYIESTEKTFLNESGTVTTSFQSGLENGDEGVVVVGNARTITPLTGASGDGELFTVTFEVVDGANAGSSSVTIASSSFLSSPTGNISVTSWPSSTFAITETSTVTTVSNLQANPGTDRYSIALAWDAVSGTEISYKVYRRNPHDTFDLLGTTALLNFLDNDSVANGGNIIPNFDYEYRVTTYNGIEESVPALVTGTDIRGLTGDNTRSDRVDGHDLENIAKSWTVDDSQTNFPVLADTSFDGTISGNDLIDLAVTWAKTYP